MAARCRGVSHVSSGIRLQDASACFSPKTAPEIFVGLISDGAGSAALGGEGASLICRTLTTEIRGHFRNDSALPEDSAIHDWIDKTRDRINTLASRRGLTAADFAGTLVGIISNGCNTVTFHVGDGCIVVLSKRDNRWVSASWPQVGEYASTTYFVTDEPGARLRINRHQLDISAIAMFSDGVERLALDFSSQEPSVKFFEPIAAPLFASPKKGKCILLREKLGAFLESPIVNSRTDDDKTLIVAVKR